MAQNDSFGAWLSKRIDSLFPNGPGDTGLVLWCDPRHEWQELLERCAQVGGFELWSDEDELLLRDRYIREPPARLLIWLPRSREEITWLKVFELEADAVWEEPLIESVRSYGVTISRDQEDELTGLLPKQALSWFDQPLSVWSQFTARGAKTNLLSDARMLELLAGTDPVFKQLSDEGQFELFRSRAIDDFGLPDPSEGDETTWRIAATARLLATDAAAHNPHNPPSDGEFLIPPGPRRDRALALLRTWMRDVQLLAFFERLAIEADKRLGLAYWARNLATPPRSFSSRAAEESYFAGWTERLDRIEELDALCQELEGNAQLFQDRSQGFWETSVSRKVGWSFLEGFAHAASLFVEQDSVETNWKSVADAVTWYTDTGWLMDQEGEALYLESPEMPQELQRIRARVRRAYRRRADAVGRVFSDLLTADSPALASYPTAGELLKKTLESEQVPTAVLLLDACRFQLGRRLAELANRGETGERASVAPALAPVPSITAVAKAFALPIARTELSVAFDTDKGAFAVTTSDGMNLADASLRRKWLADSFGLKSALSVTEVLAGDKLQRASKARQRVLVEGEEFDDEGHDGFLELKGPQYDLDRYLRAIRRLRDAGYSRTVVVTDHGYFHWTGDDEEVEPANVDGDMFWKGRRAIVGRNLRSKSAVHLAVPQSDLEVIVPRSFNAFKAYGGLGYFHGGATLQELVIPVVTIRWPHKVEKIPVVLKPLEEIVSLAQPIEVEPGVGGLFDASDESRLSRHVEIKVFDPTSGTLLFRSAGAATVTPGGTTVKLTLRKIEGVAATRNRSLDLRLIDTDNDEMLDQRSVMLRVELDEWD